VPQRKGKDERKKAQSPSTAIRAKCRGAMPTTRRAAAGSIIHRRKIRSEIKMKEKNEDKEKKREKKITKGNKWEYKRTTLNI
jgi:hypothetical protein